MFAPQPIEVRSGVAVGLVLSFYRVAPATGVASVAAYWNFVDGVFDYGVAFDKAKHLKPFVRAGVDGSDPDFKLQTCAAPSGAFDGVRTSARVYAIGPDGDRADLVQVYDSKFARELVGIDS